MFLVGFVKQTNQSQKSGREFCFGLDYVPTKTKKTITQNLFFCYFPVLY